MQNEKEKIDNSDDSQLINTKIKSYGRKKKKVLRTEVIEEQEEEQSVKGSVTDEKLDNENDTSNNIKELNLGKENNNIGVKYFPGGFSKEFEYDPEKIKRELESKIVVPKGKEDKDIYDISEERIEELIRDNVVFYVLSTFNENDPRMVQLREKKTLEKFETLDLDFIEKRNSAIKAVKKETEAYKIMQEINTIGQMMLESEEKMFNGIFIKNEIFPSISVKAKSEGLALYREFQGNDEVFFMEVGRIPSEMIAKNIFNSFTKGDVDVDFLSLAGRYPLGEEDTNLIKKTLKDYTCDSGDPYAFIERLKKLNKVRTAVFDKIFLKTKESDKEYNELIVKICTEFETDGFSIDDIIPFTQRSIERLDEDNILMFEFGPKEKENVLSKLREKRELVPMAINTRNLLFGFTGFHGAERATAGVKMGNFKMRVLITKEIEEFFDEIFPGGKPKAMPTTVEEVFTEVFVNNEGKRIHPGTYQLSSRGVIFADKKIKRDQTIELELQRGLKLIDGIRSKFSKIGQEWKENPTTRGKVYDLCKNEAEFFTQAIDYAFQFFSHDYEDIVMRTKFEVHKKEKPARLFFPSNTSANVVPQFIFNRFMGLMERPDYTLYGVSTGGVEMTDKIRTILSNSDSQKIYQYCDNIFVTGEGWYHSLDISSMEANHTPEEMLIMGIMAGLKVLPMDEWPIWITLMFLDNYFFVVKKANYSINREAYGWIPLSIMNSGRAGTAFYNDIFTKYFAWYVKKKGITCTMNGKITKDLANCFDLFGLEWKEEMKTDVSKIKEGLVEMDMLGYSAVVFSSKTWDLVPILDKSRMIKSLCFNQAITQSSRVKKVVSYLKTRNLLQNGLPFFYDLGCMAYDYLIMLSDELKSIVTDDPNLFVSELYNYGIPIEQVRAELETPIQTTWEAYVIKHTDSIRIQKVREYVKDNKALQGVKLNNNMNLINQYISNGISSYENSLKDMANLRQQYSNLVSVTNKRQFRVKQKKSLGDMVSHDGVFKLYLSSSRDTQVLSDTVFGENYLDVTTGRCKIVLQEHGKKMSALINELTNFYSLGVQYFKNFEVEHAIEQYNKALRSTQVLRAQRDMIIAFKKTSGYKNLESNQKLKSTQVDDWSKPYTTQFLNVSGKLVVQMNIPFVKDWNKIVKSMPEKGKVLKWITTITSVFVSWNGLEIKDSSGEEYIDTMHLLYTCYFAATERTGLKIHFEDFLTRMKDRNLKNIDVVTDDNIIRGGSFKELIDILVKKGKYVREVRSKDMKEAYNKISEKIAQKVGLLRGTTYDELLNYIYTGGVSEFNILERMDRWAADVLLLFLERGNFYHRIIGLLALDALFDENQDRAVMIADIIKDRVEREYTVCRSVKQGLHVPNVFLNVWTRRRLPEENRKGEVLEAFKKEKIIEVVDQIKKQNKIREQANEANSEMRLENRARLKEVETACVQSCVIRPIIDKNQTELLLCSHYTIAKTCCLLCLQMWVAGVDENVILKEHFLHGQVDITPFEGKIDVPDGFETIEEQVLATIILTQANSVKRYAINKEDGLYSLDWDTLTITPLKEEGPPDTRVCLPISEDGIALYEKNMMLNFKFNIQRELFTLMELRAKMNDKGLICFNDYVKMNEVKNIYCVKKPQKRLFEMSKSMEQLLPCFVDTAIINSEFFDTGEEGMIPIYIHLATQQFFKGNWERYVFTGFKDTFTKLINVGWRINKYKKVLDKKNLSMPLWMKCFLFTKKVMTEIKVKSVNYNEAFYMLIYEELKRHNYRVVCEANFTQNFHEARDVYNPNLSEGDKKIYTSLGLDVSKVKNVRIRPVEVKGWDLEVSRSIGCLKNPFVDVENVEVYTADHPYVRKRKRERGIEEEENETTVTNIEYAATQLLGKKTPYVSGNQWCPGKICESFPTYDVTIWNLERDYLMFGRIGYLEEYEDTNKNKRNTSYWVIKIRKSSIWCNVCQEEKAWNVVDKYLETDGDEWVRGQFDLITDFECCECLGSTIKSMYNICLKDGTTFFFVENEQYPSREIITPDVVEDEIKEEVEMMLQDWSDAGNESPQSFDEIFKKDSRLGAVVRSGFVNNLKGKLEKWFTHSRDNYDFAEDSESETSKEEEFDSAKDSIN